MLQAICIATLIVFFMAATRSAAADGQGKVTVVTMTDDDVFKPETVTINIGDTVRWENKGTKDAHTVTDDAKAAGDAKEVAVPTGATAFNSGEIKPGKTFEQRFTVAGTYRYVCKPHEEMGMKGQVVVEQPK